MEGTFESDREHLLVPDAERTGVDPHSPDLGVNASGQSSPTRDVCNHGNKDAARDAAAERSIQDGGSADSHQKEFVVYAERWYILAIFSTIAFLQCCCWNTWGPIEDTAMAVLGWNAGQFALLANWGPIMFVVSGFFFSWLLHAKGLRTAVLVTGGLLVIGVSVRCIPVPKSKMIWTINVGHIFIGLGGPVCMAAVTALSAAWFPANERTTATAFSSTFPYLGLASSFLIGPLIVGEIPSSANVTTISPLTTAGGNFSSQGDFSSGYISEEDLDEHYQGIKLLMYIECALTVLFYIAAVIYFPSAPVTPPTASAIVKREDMVAGMFAIVKKVSFWIPAAAYAISTGAYNGWGAQMVVIFNNKIDQTTAGWLGFYTNVSALVGGVLVARCADYLGGRMKLIILLLLTGSCGTILWTILLVNDYIPYSEASLFTSVILFGLFLNASIPLFMEVTVEGAFPVGEETTTMLMTWMNNVFALLFLLVPLIPSVDQNFGWLNWMMLGSAVFCLPLMLLYREHYNRLDFDTSHQQDSENYNRLDYNTSHQGENGTSIQI